MPDASDELRAVPVQNPILPGFNPDPSIVRRGDDYYIATSTFEWFPAVQIHHSTDLVNWDLIGHAITDDSINLRGIPASGGVWAPCLSVDPVDGRFYLVYSVMKGQEAEVFDVDNYVIWADSILGPWSPPLYVNSVGFDSSLFHDDDGRKWLVTLEWETRPGHEHPGWIVAQRFDPATGEVGAPVRIHHGSTGRGAMEAPHLYKHDGRYYLMTAEGGTGFGHGVCLARAHDVLGPYESDPGSPFITSHPEPYFGRNHRDFLRRERFNPDTTVHKAGHGSLVESADGNWYVAHLSARVLPNTDLSILGRETSLQPVHWSADGWLRTNTGSPLAEEFVSIPARTDSLPRSLDISTDFAEGLSVHLATPRGPWSATWCRTDEQGLTLTGRDSLHSRFDVSLVATRLRGFEAEARVPVRFEPTHFSQSAGLTVFYDHRNFLFARISYSETTASRSIAVVRARADETMDEVLGEMSLPDGELEIRVTLADGLAQFSWRASEPEWTPIGIAVDTSFMSDEVVRGFTGQFVGIAAVDAVARRRVATFGRFTLRYPQAAGDVAIDHAASAAET
jgi:xylan 1,4-beta-xylosidase